MRLLQRLREWRLRRLGRRAIRRDARVLDSKIRGVVTRVLESQDRFAVLYAKTREELEIARLQCEQFRREVAELERNQEQLMNENEGLREVRKYYDELLIPAMTQGHSKVMALLEAETAIQIKRQVASRTVE